jgi:hypothetical protein
VIRRLLAASVLLAVLPTSALAESVLVDPGGGGDYTDIWRALWYTPAGDTVFVVAGTYSGEYNRNLTFHGKDIVLVSQAGPGLTVIDAEGAAPCFHFEDGETPAAVVSGFTIMNGYSGYGAGIRCMNGSSPTITNCYITDCTATQASNGGGGLSCSSGASPVVSDVVFSRNQGERGGAVFSCGGGAPLLTNVRFEENTAETRGGGWACETPGTVLTIAGCVFLGNTVTEPGGWGGGLSVIGSSALITGTTFAENGASDGGCVWADNDASATIENSILAFSTEGGAEGGYGSLTTTECVVFGNVGGDDLMGDFSEIINEDPRFCDIYAGDLTLCANSICLPENNTWGDLVGALGEGCEACDSPAEVSSWSAIKAMYKE